ncbi:MAG: YidC/Oxa1 family insertase periplasmic-domain containing protein [Gemmataceae bacterium]|nr:YidC/Oxa1 family insertase periplasmic-domain containing protein [Gemmataceae bacterium]
MVGLAGSNQAAHATAEETVVAVAVRAFQSVAARRILNQEVWTSGAVGAMAKNYAAFIVVSIFISLGWIWFQNRQQQQRFEALKQAKAGLTKQVLEKKNSGNNKAPKNDAGKGKIPTDSKAEPNPKTKQPPAEPDPEPPLKVVTLGSDSTYLRADLTTRGAGVQKLVLTRFKAADYLGRPTDRELELIQEDSITPSFLMYHYPTHEHDHPVLPLGQKNWHFEGQTKNDDGVEEARFSTRIPGQEDVKIVKTYRLGPQDYHLTLRLDFERDKGDDAKELLLRYQLAGAHGLPVEGEWYTTTFRRALIGWLDDRNYLYRELENEDAYRISYMAGGKRVPAQTSDKDLILYGGVATQYFASMIVVDDKQPDRSYQGNERRQILEWARPTLETVEQRGHIAEVRDDALELFESDTKKTRSYVLLPRVKAHLRDARFKKNDAVMVSYYSTPDDRRVATWIRPSHARREYIDDITVRVNSKPLLLPPGGKVSHQFLLYHGPVKVGLLRQFSGDKAVASALIDRYADTLQLATLTDYRSPGPLGRFSQAIRLTDLIIACTRLMHWLLYWLSVMVFGSQGIAILLLTVLVRGMMFPISKKQAIFSIKMQEMAPELKKLAEQYKDDPRGRMEAQSKLYKKHGVNPFSGCLPMFLQLPIFLGLYFALQESISFRLAGFLWIENLAAPDMLLWWSESIPIISSPDNQSGLSRGLLESILGMFYLGPYLNILPIFAVALMVVQQKLMVPPPVDEQQAMQQKMMKYMMILIGIMFYKVASGLCIYFIASSAWGMAERKLLPKRPQTSAPAVPPSTASGKAPPKRGKAREPAKREGSAAMTKVKEWWRELLKEAQKK